MRTARVPRLVLVMKALTDAAPIGDIEQDVHQRRGNLRQVARLQVRHGRADEHARGLI